MNLGDKDVKAVYDFITSKEGQKHCDNSEYHQEFIESVKILNLKIKGIINDDDDPKVVFTCFGELYIWIAIRSGISKEYLLSICSHSYDIIKNDMGES